MVRMFDSVQVQHFVDRLIYSMATQASLPLTDAQVNVVVFVSPSLLLLDDAIVLGWEFYCPCLFIVRLSRRAI